MPSTGIGPCGPAQAFARDRMAMAVEHKLRAFLPHDFGEGAMIAQVADVAAAIDRRVVNAAAPGMSSRVARRMLARRANCSAPSLPDGDEGQGGHAAAQADDRDPVAAAQEGKALIAVVAARPGAEIAHHVRQARAHIGVVVAGRDAHLLRQAERRQPLRGERIFRRQADVADVAGHGDMVGPVARACRRPGRRGRPCHGRGGGRGAS